MRKSSAASARPRTSIAKSAFPSPLVSPVTTPSSTRSCPGLREKASSPTKRKAWSPRRPSFASIADYKALTGLERAFRTLKSVDLEIRPIHHRLEDRVRAHILLCMLAYYVEWHMREAWRDLTFADEEQEAKVSRDPVAPARRSAAAKQKARTRQLHDGTPAHSFRTLLEALATIVSNTCRVPGSTGNTATFTLLTTPNALQRRARELIDTISP